MNKKHIVIVEIISTGFNFVEDAHGLCIEAPLAGKGKLMIASV